MAENNTLENKLKGAATSYREAFALNQSFEKNPYDAGVRAWVGKQIHAEDNNLPEDLLDMATPEAVAPGLRQYLPKYQDDLIDVVAEDFEGVLKMCNREALKQIILSMKPRKTDDDEAEIVELHTRYQALSEALEKRDIGAYISQIKPELQPYISSLARKMPKAILGAFANYVKKTEEELWSKLFEGSWDARNLTTARNYIKNNEALSPDEVKKQLYLITGLTAVAETPAEE